MTDNMETGKAAFGDRSVFVPNPNLKLLEQVREICRLKHFSLRTEQSYMGWAKRYLVFCKNLSGQWRHPRESGGEEVTAFLSHLATAGVRRCILQSIPFTRWQSSE